MEINDEDETKDLDTLVKSFNRLDNYVAKYIYQKYIKQDLGNPARKHDEESSFLEKQDLENPARKSSKKNDYDESSFLEKSRAKNDDENPSLEKQDLENPARKHDEEKPSLDKFLKTIFDVERPCIITQKESLETDLENMAIADEAYDKDPKTYKLRKYNSVPDIKRCSFIRKHKNKYKRCNNSIINDDSDTCYKHIESLNIYWDRYCEVLREIENSVV